MDGACQRPDRLEHPRQALRPVYGFGLLHPGWPTSFPELNDLLAAFVGRVRAILETDLIGVYLTGSFALGDGDGDGDCDFLVVTSGRLGSERERALRWLHRGMPDRPGYWAYNLEGSYAR
jgi:hypothetical protein